MRELLLDMASAMSYRKTAALLNRVRHETVDPTPMTTVAAMTEREGTAVQAHMDQWATQVLADHAFTDTARPQVAAAESFDAPMTPSLPQSCIDQAIAAYNAEKPEALHIPAEAATEFYENPEQTVNVSIDDVGVKKQKGVRIRSTVEEPPQASPSHADSSRTAKGHPPTKRTPRPKAPRAYVHNTVAHVETTHGWYVLTGFGTIAVLRLVVAFLLYRGVLHDHFVQFFVDGQRTLHAAILERWNWLGSKRILLDWFHLQEKCEKELSTALRGRQVRNRVLDHLLPLLWLGRVDAAIDYLRTLGAETLKTGQSVDLLVGYFERNRAYIPCYALRKQLGLRNSSNRGEKANDLCVAERQKHHSMSWSPKGSVALASVVTLQHNREAAHWCADHHLDFQWVA